MRVQDRPGRHPSRITWQRGLDVMGEDLRVGIIGASATRGWARDSHVPAVQGLAGLRLGAVVGTDQRSADAAAAPFGAAKGYGHPASRFADPSIAVVTVAVAAGKHLYCEWPLGRDLPEAEELAAAARTAGVHAAIGLQTRMNPAARQARALIADGAIGHVLGVRVLSTTMAFGPKVEAAMLFGEDAANGVTLPTIQGAHTIDHVAAMLGAFETVAALASTQFPTVTVEGEMGPRARPAASSSTAARRAASSRAGCAWC